MRLEQSANLSKALSNPRCRLCRSRRKPMISLATPAGLEPATVGLEVRGNALQNKDLAV